MASNPEFQIRSMQDRSENSPDRLAASPENNKLSAEAQSGMANYNSIRSVESSKRTADTSILPSLTLEDKFATTIAPVRSEKSVTFTPARVPGQLINEAVIQDLIRESEKMPNNQDIPIDSTRQMFERLAAQPPNSVDTVNFMTHGSKKAQLDGSTKASIIMGFGSEHNITAASIRELQAANPELVQKAALALRTDAQINIMACHAGTDPKLCNELGDALLVKGGKVLASTKTVNPVNMEKFKADYATLYPWRAALENAPILRNLISSNAETRGRESAERQFGKKFPVPTKIEMRGQLIEFKIRPH